MKPPFILAVTASTGFMYITRTDKFVACASSDKKLAHKFETFESAKRYADGFEKHWRYRREVTLMEAENETI